MANEEPLPIAVVIHELVQVLGFDPVALIAGATSKAEVRGWMSGEGRPQREQYLRYALQATRILLPEGPEIAAAWFDGENHHFNGDPPALALRDGPPEVGAAVVRAALAFVEG